MSHTFHASDLWCAAFLAALGVAVAPGCGDDGATPPSSSANNSETSTNTSTSTNSTSGSPETPFPCTSPEPIMIEGRDIGFDRCAEGFERRREALACEDRRVADYVCGDGENGSCASDADCTARPYGACRPQQTIPPSGSFCGCTYGCLTDADCDPGHICRCAAPSGRCVPSDCATDEDCPDTMLCASYTLNPGCPGVGFRCQTADDVCVIDDDCDTSEQCTVSGDSGQRVCAPRLCGVNSGRPFLVEGHERTAEPARRADWCADGLVPSTRGLSDALREAMRAHWTEAGLMEHASVAAFARSALQLMALGAPPDLLVRTQAAMSDEIKHARDCFALASAYAGAPIGPGPLGIEGALEEVALRDVLGMVIREGCIGETVAALEAVEALGASQDPVVCGVLEVIAADERAHALLAWDTVRWALASGDADMRVWLRRAFDDAIAELDAEPNEAEGDLSDALLLRHGVVSPHLRGELRRYVLRALVRPCAEALLADHAPVAERVEVGA